METVAVALKRPEVGEPPMAEMNRLCLLKMRVSGEDDGEIGFRPLDERGLKRAEFGLKRFQIGLQP